MTWPTTTSSVGPSSGTPTWKGRGRRARAVTSCSAARWKDPADTAILLFRADSAQVVEDFARTDPYVLNGLVTNWRVREWVTVAGDTAVTPVRPASAAS
ncbi:MAG: hypothetical protein R2712_18360 [Vicinamibacterales bacterium]